MLTLAKKRIGGAAYAIAGGSQLAESRPAALLIPGRGAPTQEQENDDYLLRWATFVGCAALLFQFIAYNFVDIDIWHQMALIRESLSAGHLLKADPYAYTPTLPWIDHEWGAGVIVYFSTAWLGSRAIVSLKFLTALGTGFLCLRCSEARGGDFRILIVCTPLAIFLAYLGFFATIRAQAYSFFLIALWLWFLDRDLRGSRAWMIAALAIFPFWVNLHAGFVVALGFTAVQALENRLRNKPFSHLLLLLIGMSVEIFVNPYGIRYFSYLQRALSMPRPFAPEWGPIYTLGSAWTAAFVAVLLIAVYSAWSVGWSRTPGILLVACSAIEAALHRKLLPLFAVAWLCYVPSYLQAAPLGAWWVKFARRRGRFLSTAWITIFCLCAVAAIRQKPWKLFVPQPLYPVGPVQYLAKQGFVGNLMVPFRLGAYVSWRLYPAVEVSLDSRYEVAYPDAVVAQVFNFYAAGSGWRSTLTSFPTDAVLIPADAPIATLMPQTGWQRVYIDQQFQIYARSGSDLPIQDWRSTSFEGTFP
jgi:hypothetical protein